MCVHMQLRCPQAIGPLLAVPLVTALNSHTGWLAEGLSPAAWVASALCAAQFVCVWRGITLPADDLEAPNTQLTLCARTDGAVSGKL